MSTARQISKRQARGDAMSSILNPVNGYRGALERKGVKPKNHHMENLRAIKAKQYHNRISKAVKNEADIQKEQEKRVLREKMFKDVDSRVAQHKAAEPKKGHQFLRRQSAGNLTTSPAKPYVSKKVKNKAGLPDLSRDPISARRPESKPKNFVANNRSAAATTKRRGPKQNKISTNKNFGKIPDYIIERKIEIAQQKEAKRQAAQKQEVPPGMILVPEAERLETLRQLQAGKKEVATQLARFPLVVETLSRKQAKQALEKKMKEIEDAIKTFKQKKVFIEE